MARTLITLALAAMVLGISTLCALPFESWIGRAVALWPGLVLQRLFRPAGISFTDGTVFLSTLLFWWLAVWLALRYWLSRTPEFISRTALICPFCKHQFPLTWRRYFTNMSGRHVCPSCGQGSKIRTGLPYWAFYAPLVYTSPFALTLFALAVYGFFVPKLQFEEDLAGFFGSPWLMTAFVALWAILFPVDRALDVRLRGLQVPKDGKKAA